MRRVLLAVAAICFLAQSHAARAMDDPASWANQFIGIVAKGDADAVIKYLKQRSALGRARPNAVQALQENFAAMFRSYGPVSGTELVKTENLGVSLRAYSYLVKMRKTPVLIRLYFYKPGSDWEMTYIALEDNVPKMFGHLDPSSK